MDNSWKFGEIITSTNGSDWVTRHSQYNGSILTAVDYANGYYVAANDQIDQWCGDMCLFRPTSILGRNIIRKQGPPLYALAYGNNTWVAVGHAGGHLDFDKLDELADSNVGKRNRLDRNHTPTEKNF